MPVIDPVLALRDACATARSARAWSRAHGLSPQYVADVLSRRRPPSDRILAALGLVMVAVRRPPPSPSLPSPLPPFPAGFRAALGLPPIPGQ